MYKELTELLCSQGTEFYKDEPLKKHTSFKIGGPADLFVIPKNEEELIAVYKKALRLKLPAYILGKGSNVLFSDDGYRGVVISTEGLCGVRVEENILYAQCGASFTHIAAVARDGGLGGLEFAFGIPGAVGGAVYMNAGAYGGQVSDCLYSSRAYDPNSDTVVTTYGADHGFGYRTSIYKHSPEMIVLSAEFKLDFADKAEVKAKMDDFMDRRKDKQPLEYPSAGSVFKRPEGYFVGQLIEELGLKGYSVGGAQISEKHAGFIINKGDATAKDVLGLIDYIKARVKAAYGVELECEVIYVK